SMLLGRWWSTSCPLYRRDLVDQAGPWLGLRSEEDWGYDCRIARQKDPLHYCPEFVSDTIRHAFGLSVPCKVSSVRRKDRTVADELIVVHAKHAGFGPDNAEMQHFARELFLLARQCGAAGLPDDAKRLFGLAREASGPERSCGIDFLAYRAAAGVLGW